MGWLWFIFLIFAVLSNLMEKAAKMNRPSDLPRKGQGGGSPAPRPVAFPPFFWEVEEEEAKPVPVQEGNAEPETAGPSLLEKADRAPAQHVEKRQKSWNDEFSQVPQDDYAFQEMTGFNDTLPQAAKQTALSEQENLQEEMEHDEFLSAIVLAQVLARPDFKTVPWQRRL